jgi:hypothetical protein
MRTRGIIYQQININAERQQFPQPQILTPDDNHFGRNMSWKLLKWLAFIMFKYIFGHKTVELIKNTCMNPFQEGLQLYWRKKVVQQHVNKEMCKYL